MSDEGAVVLVTGDRNWGWKWYRGKKVEVPEEINFMGMVLDEINRSPGIKLLVEGDAPGADYYAGVWAVLNQVPYEAVAAEWEKYRKVDQRKNPAGIIRNIKMYDTYKPDVVVAFHRNYMASKGTKHMVEYALWKRECMVVIHPSPVWG